LGIVWRKERGSQPYLPDRIGLKTAWEVAGIIYGVRPRMGKQGKKQGGT